MLCMLLCILEAVQGASRTALCGRDAGGYASCAGGMEIRSSGDSLQACRLYRMDLRSSGGVLQACRCLPQELRSAEARCGRVGVCLKSSGALEARCRRVRGIERRRRTADRGGMELWSRTAGVQTWSVGLRRRAVGIATWRNGGMELGRCAAGV